ncbi:10863_t:CDS:2 [Paraglomus occultum]|uniref:10863_t:CDS:1 n=1 Tax=Paraglomus occultum TaxID=144539 RepID=A0A9N9AXH3_9GLOM|nr:10863_t:CDS:2 [Paraglomus occultum]
MTLKQIIETLVRRERDNNDNHVCSSLQPRRGGFEYLDVLARLILGKEDVCAARFANNPQEAGNYITLAEIAMERVLEVNSLRTRYRELTRLKDEIVNYRSNRNFSSNDKLNSLNTIQNLAQVVYNKITEERRLANRERQNGREDEANRINRKANWA